MDLVRCVADFSDRLGEGPCWAASEGRLYWFDIKGKRIHWLIPETGETDDLSLPLQVSAAAPREAGGLIMATEKGLATLDPSAGRVQLVHPFELEPGFRTNDGRVDPQGRFWWSTMDDDDGARPGAVFVTHADGRTDKVLEGIHIANALSVSADGRTLFLADSKRQTIWAFDPTDSSTRRVFARTSGSVFPDGAALDAEGFLWNAQWGGAQVVRYSPDGSIDRVVKVPVSQPTSCAFGGPDLSTLYVTSAWHGLAESASARPDGAGALFAFEPGVTGLPLPAFAGWARRSRTGA